MTLRPLSSLALFFFISLLAGLSQDKPAEKSAPPKDFSKEAYVLERWNTVVKMENDGTGMRERTVEVKVLSDAGVKALAVLDFPYTSANENVEFDYVRVRKPDGTVVKTPDYNIQDMPAEVSREAPLYSDVHEKHVAVKGLAVGDVLEYVVRARVTTPQVPGEFWYETSFLKQTIVREERLEINLPKDKYVKVVSPEFKPEVKEDGGRRVYVWTHSNLEVKEKDSDEQPRRTLPMPDVQMTTFASWDDVGNWYGGLQKDPLTVTPAIQKKAAELTNGLKTDDEKIHAIYNFVALKYHYIGLDFGIGRFQPHAADDVLDNNYGDCKDKHTLLAALLKAAGYDAWPALIHGQRKLDPDVPSPGQFNHVITVVPRGADVIWLDTTPEVAPYRFLLQPLRNKQALVIPTDKPAKLMTTPENAPQAMRQEFSMQGKLDGDGTFNGHAEISYDGDSGFLLRVAFRRVAESQWKELMQRLSQGMNFGGEVSNVKVTPPDELDKPFEISYDYVRKGYAGWESHQTNAPLPPMGVESIKGVQEKKPRESVPLVAGKITYRSRVELPEGYRVLAPVPSHLTGTYADYDGRTIIENGVMTTTRVMTVKKNEVPLGDWEEFRKFGEGVYDDEYNMLTVDKMDSEVAAEKHPGKDSGDGKDKGAGSTNTIDVDKLFRDGSYAMQQRDFLRAQELFEKVIAARPGYKEAHNNLGLAFLGQNKISAGIAEFHKAEDLSPNDTKSYQVLASYLMATGHKEEAIEEWRRLLKVEPENHQASTQVTTLLFQMGKYADAAEFLEAAVRASPDSAVLELALGEAYVRSGQPEKGIPHLKGVAQKSSEPSILNDVAYMLAENKGDLDLALQYAEKAVGKLEEQSQGAASSDEAGMRVTYQFALAWDTLGWVHFRRGETNSAESYVRAAWLLGQDGIVGEHLGEIYEKLGKTKEAVHVYELSGSTLPSLTGPPPLDLSQAQKRAGERYEKLTGHRVSVEIKRLPNGEWTQTPGEQLRAMREAKVSNSGKVSGTADFAVVFEPNSVEAHFMRGDEELKDLEDKLEAAHYKVEFPPDSAASLVRRVQVVCKPMSVCTATLVKPDQANLQLPGPAY